MLGVNSGLGLGGKATLLGKPVQVTDYCRAGGIINASDPLFTRFCGAHPFIIRSIGIDMDDAYRIAKQFNPFSKMFEMSKIHSRLWHLRRGTSGKHQDQHLHHYCTENDGKEVISHSSFFPY